MNASKSNPKQDNQKSSRRTTHSETGQLLTDEELAAMKEHLAAEKKAARRAAKGEPVDLESDVLEKISEMEPHDRHLAERLHALIKANAPELAPRLWYGMPAYSKDGRVLCFFQAAQKFKARYATFGFNDAANVDEGDMWPVAYALKDLNAGEEARIAALLKKAVS